MIHFVKHSDQHICKPQPTEAPTFYLEATIKTHPKYFKDIVTLHVSIVKPMSGHQMGENNYLRAVGGVSNGAKHANTEKGKHKRGQ